ncbi:thyrotropin-releasing hormone receptor-like [Physella acuta]|uniref:thyrotropin-releasing hormone receptor-like n=1 Tax=Physella acuta TaxID=109671 RepID=UPI0027DBDEB0|nr:thyrotropin-releasing hormone receptor-like [Physella acuta]
MNRSRDFDFLCETTETPFTFTTNVTLNLNFDHMVVPNVPDTASQNLVELVNQFDVYLNTYIIHFMCAFGIVGNVLTIYIITKCGFRDTTNIVLLSLSVSDLVYSLTTEVCYVRKIIHLFDIYLEKTYYAYYIIILLTINGIGNASSFLLVVIISIERFIAVWFPLHVTRIITPFRMKCAVIFVYVYLFILVIPDYMCYYIIWYHKSNLNITYGWIGITQFYTDNSDTLNSYFMLYRNNILTTIPLIVVIICTTMITVKLISVSKFTKQNAKKSTSRILKDMKVIKMLLTVCIVYIITVVPTTSLDIYMTYTEIQPAEKNLIIYIQTIFYQINASVNFIIYITVSSKFSEKYRSLFTGRGKATKIKF